MIPGTYLGASAALKIWDPAIFPTQYPTKVKEEVNVLLVLPATLLGIKVQARNPEMTKGNDMKNPPHLVHLYSGSFGRRAMMRKPMKGGKVENIMKYVRIFCHLLVTTPTTTKYSIETTLRGISRRMTWRFVNPKVMLMMAPNVVSPPLGTEVKNALMPVNQNCKTQSVFTPTDRMKKEVTYARIY